VRELSERRSAQVGRAGQRGPVLGRQRSQAPRQEGVLARADAEEQRRALVGDRQHARAGVPRVGDPRDQPLLLELGDQPRSRRPLDALALGHPARGERPVALDRAEGRDQRGAEVSAGLLPQPPGRAREHDA
jgi:hypothetical protein